MAVRQCVLVATVMLALVMTAHGRQTNTNPGTLGKISNNLLSAISKPARSVSDGTKTVMDVLKKAIDKIHYSVQLTTDQEYKKKYKKLITHVHRSEDFSQFRAKLAALKLQGHQFSDKYMILSFLEEKGKAAKWGYAADIHRAEQSRRGAIEFMMHACNAVLTEGGFGQPREGAQWAPAELLSEVMADAAKFQLMHKNKNLQALQRQYLSSADGTTSPQLNAFRHGNAGDSGDASKRLKTFGVCLARLLWMNTQRTDNDNRGDLLQDVARGCFTALRKLARNDFREDMCNKASNLILRYIVGKQDAQSDVLKTTQFATKAARFLTNLLAAGATIGATIIALAISLSAAAGSYGGALMAAPLITGTVTAATAAALAVAKPAVEKVVDTFASMVANGKMRKHGRLAILGTIFENVLRTQREPDPTRRIVPTKGTDSRVSDSRDNSQREYEFKTVPCNERFTRFGTLVELLFTSKADRGQWFLDTDSAVARKVLDTFRDDLQNNPNLVAQIKGDSVFKTFEKMVTTAAGQAGGLALTAKQMNAIDIQKQQAAVAAKQAKDQNDRPN